MRVQSLKFRVVGTVVHPASMVLVLLLSVVAGLALDCLSQIFVRCRDYILRKLCGDGTAARARLDQDVCRLCA
jgi:hypothetical protein